jgi:hypothetical protein
MDDSVEPIAESPPRRSVSWRELLAFLTTGYVVMNGLGPLLHKAGLVKRVATVRVDGEPWRQVDDLRACGPGDKVFRLDPNTGSIEFGDGVHGRVPPGRIEATSKYRYGAGAAGVIGGVVLVCALWTLSIWIRWRKSRQQ